MQKIKNFIYLDVDKVYSLSSQVFEGVTEYVISDKNKVDEELKNQKGPVGSGRVVADIMRTEMRISEKKYLHDQSYSLLEAKLKETKRVLEVEEGVGSEDILSSNKWFFKVKATGIFNDLNSLQLTLSDFNKISNSLNYVSLYSEKSD